MPNVVGSRKRIRLSKHTTYEAALAAKYAEKRYRQDELQIKKRLNGKQFDLMARISVNNNTVENVN